MSITTHLGCLVCLLVLGAVQGEPEQLKLTSCLQSSTTIPQSVCEKAIDGNLNQIANKDSCTHTNLEAGWWVASTEKLARIKEIKIFNRIDCCSDRLTNFVVTVDGHECGSYNSAESFSVKTFKCDLVGQAIMIKSRKVTYLALCEVQVFGSYVTHESSQLRLSGCQQSSTTIPQSVCEKAIDGNLNQIATKDSCTHTNLEAGWWKASTEKLARIKEVKIFNRLDCCADRLTNFVVTVDGHECGSYNSADEFSVLSIKCDIVGQTVMIKTRKTTNLSLCEVQVHGELVPDSPKFKFLGCFVDAKEAHDLPNLAASDSMTPKKCNSLCGKRGTAYFGLQAGTQCWCGDNYGSNGNGNESECKMACSGDSGDTCGGDLRNAVFEVDKTVA